MQQDRPVELELLLYLAGATSEVIGTFYRALKRKSDLNRAKHPSGALSHLPENAMPGRKGHTELMRGVAGAA
jgi:hypothetical protein